MMLNEEQVRHYDEFGYVIVHNMFSMQSVNLFKQEAGYVAPKDYRVYLNIHRKVKVFRELTRHPVLVQMVKQVQRSKVVCTNDQYLYKKAGTPYAKQAWSPHQDATYVDAPYGTYMQLFIFLDSSDRDNGGLFYYPGSHKEKMLTYTYTRSWHENFDKDGVSHPGWTVQVPSKYRRKNITARKGDVCLQHGNLIHGSYANLSKRNRAQYSIAYLNEGTKIRRGKASVKIPVSVE